MIFTQQEAAETPGENSSFFAPLLLVGYDLKCICHYVAVRKLAVQLSVFKIQARKKPGL